MEKITITYPTKGDVDLAECGFVPYQTIPLPSISNEKQIFYRKCRGDKIERKNGQLIISLSDDNTGEIVVIDTKKNAVMGGDVWLSVKELSAFLTKTKELQLLK